MHFVRERDALKTEVERLSATVTDIGRREGHLKDELDKVTKDVSSLLLHYSSSSEPVFVGRSSPPQSNQRNF